MLTSIDENKTIYTEDNTPIQWFEADMQTYLDKTTLIFGGSSSGKTTIIEEILQLTKDYIPNYIVIAPKTSNKAYKKKLPARCIKEDLNKETLQKIWDRQYNTTQLYNTANDITNLESLFKRAPNRQSVVMIRVIIQSATNKINDIRNNKQLNFAQKKTQNSNIDDLRIRALHKLYKNSIRENKTNLLKMDLTIKEKITLEYLDFNPRLMLIIDDSSEKFQMWMKYYKKSEINPFESIFYKGRWNYITLIFAAHDDSIVPPKLRKNARVTYFTNSSTLVASLDRKSSGYTSHEKKLAHKMADTIFTEEKGNYIKNHKKFCYIREDADPFRYMISDLYPEFSLGSDALVELTKKMPKVDDDLLDNPYLKDMVGQTKVSKKKITLRHNSSRSNKHKYN